MLKIQYSLAGSRYSKLEICGPEICEPDTTLEKDYEEMLNCFKNLSISSTIQEELSDIRQRMHCISIWEAGVFAHADLVKTKEEAIFAQEVIIQTLENRSENLLCKICYQNDSVFVLAPCLHISMCSTCHARVYDQCPVCRTVIHDSRVVYIT